MINAGGEGAGFGMFTWLSQGGTTVAELVAKPSKAYVEFEGIVPSLGQGDKSKGSGINRVVRFRATVSDTSTMLNACVYVQKPMHELRVRRIVSVRRQRKKGTSVVGEFIVYKGPVFAEMPMGVFVVGDAVPK
jgi:hypothetical protein